MAKDGGPGARISMTASRTSSGPSSSDRAACLRRRHASFALCPGFGVEHVAQTVTDEIEGEDSQQQSKSRSERVHRHGGQMDGALADHLSPGRRWWRHAETDEAQAGLQTNG